MTSGHVRTLHRVAVSVDVAFATDARLGEGPVWDRVRAALLWVDIERGEIHALDPRSGRDEVLARFPDSVGAVVPRRDGGSLAAVGAEVVFVSSTGVTDSRRRVTRRRGVRLNDGACDQSGRFWIGAMAADGRPGRGALFVVSTDRLVQCVFKRLGIANGLDWTDDGARMYFIDSLEQRVDVCAMVDGFPVDRRPFAEIPSGIGTPDGLTDLYITSACLPLSASARRDEPLAGSVFVLRPGVAGRPAPTFAG